MNPSTILAVIILIFVVAGLAYLWVQLDRAEEGYEDASGYHKGKPPKGTVIY